MGVVRFGTGRSVGSSMMERVVRGVRGGGPGPWHFLCELGVGCRGNKYGIDQVL